MGKEKGKGRGKGKGGSDGVGVEEIRELMVVDKKKDGKLGVEGVSEIEKEGKGKRVGGEEKNEK